MVLRAGLFLVVRNDGVLEIDADVVGGAFDCFGEKLHLRTGDHQHAPLKTRPHWLVSSVAHG